MRRTIAVLSGLSFILTPLSALAREFDFTKPTPKTQFSAPPSSTRLVPPPQIGPRPAVPPTAPVQQNELPDPEEEAAPATASRAGSSRSFDLSTTQFDLPKGTRLVASVLRELAYSPLDSVAMTLQVNDDVRDVQGEVVIPKGSTVWGNFQPLYKEKASQPPPSRRVRVNQRDSWPEGSRFVAERVSIGDRIYDIKAETDLLPTQQDSKRDVGADAGNGALIGVAGGALITLLTGGLGLIPILAAGAIGAGAGAASATQPVVVVKPDKALTLTLAEPLRIR